MSPALIQLAISQAPAVLGLIRDAWAKRYPGAAEPTDEQIIAAYKQAFEASLAKSQAWLDAHPKPEAVASNTPREYAGDMTDRA